MLPRESRRRILEFVAQNDLTSATQLALSLGASETDVKRQLNILAHDGLVTFAMSKALTLEQQKYVQIELTPDGWKALEVEDHEAQPTSPAISNVWNFYGSKIDNLIQNYGDKVTINQATASDSFTSIFQIVDKMVEEVSQSAELPGEVKNDYSIEAQSFKGELRKSRINLRRLREMLAFLGDVEGTLGLTARLAPWFIALQPYIERVIEHLSR